MNENDIKRMIEETYDDSREDSLRGMIGVFYSRKMWSTAVMVWAWGLIFMAGAIYCAVKFFGDITVRDQIMYATLFVTCWVGVAIMKMFAWQMLHRHSIKREIKQLELRIAELTARLK